MRWPALIVLCLTLHADAQNVFGFSKTVRRESFEVQPASSDSSCVLWLPFEYDDGTNYYDSSTALNNATATNAATQPTYSAGVLVTDGVNNNLLIGNTASICNASRMSITAWVKYNGVVSPSAFGTVATVQDGVAGKFFFIIQTDLTIDLAIQRVGDTVWQQNVSTNRVASNAWTFVCGTYDGTNVTDYINGTADKMLLVAGVLSNSTAVVNIGSWRSVSHLFKGGLDDVRIFDRALTAGEVEGIYNQTRGASRP
jgi:hypothetical protein